MFNEEFYPTPLHLIRKMIPPNEVKGKKFLEPEAGKGDIVDYLYNEGADLVSACETNEDLRKILFDKCKLIGKDFLQLKPHQISHVDYIVMNPPFSNADEHILHAYNIAPAGCKIRALCNYATIDKLFTAKRKELRTLIDMYGDVENWGDCFTDAERKTGVEVAFIRLEKAAAKENNEFEGFFMEEEPEEKGENGIMKFDAVRDIVQRYVNAVKCWDEFEVIRDKMSSLTGAVKVGTFGFEVGYNETVHTKEDFKKALQRKSWDSIFRKLNMDKYATQGVKDDINKFIETQQKVPFTMKNIYHMLYIVVGTQQSRMDKAILEVFDKVTKHYDENRYNVEGWKTNSHYLLNQRFIIPNCVETGWSGQVSRGSWSSGNFEKIEDMLKALCYISGNNYDDFPTLENTISYPYRLEKNGKVLRKQYDTYSVPYTEKTEEALQYAQSQHPGSKIVHTKVEFGQWFDWAYFRVRPYKKGTLHIEFKDKELWGKFNQIVAKLKGYPLYENKTTTNKPKPQETPKTTVKPNVLFTVKLK